MLGCSVTDVKQVTELAPLLFVPQMRFMDFFARTSQLPLALGIIPLLLVLLAEFSLHNASLPVQSSCTGQLPQPAGEQ
jgi:hypothetical protein